MFKGQKTKNIVPADDVETIIGPSVKIEGDFQTNGNVMIAGIISGTFTTSHSLRVEEQARIIANVKAGEAIIAGEIKGNIEVENHLEILSSAKIDGDIKTGSISIQQGARINGNCSMTGSEAATEKLKPSSAEPLVEKTKKEVTQDWLIAGQEEAESD